MHARHRCQSLLPGDRPTQFLTHDEGDFGLDARMDQGVDIDHLSLLEHHRVGQPPGKRGVDAHPPLLRHRCQTKFDPHEPLTGASTPGDQRVLNVVCRSQVETVPHVGDPTTVTALGDTSS
jgi:hypothetical protein